MTLRPNKSSPGGWAAPCTLGVLEFSLLLWSVCQGTARLSAGECLPGSASPTGRAASQTLARWATDEVPYIIVTEEMAQYAKLKTDRERREFIKEFWERRNPTPGSRVNKFKEEYYRRVAFAKQHFGYPETAAIDDRSKMYILYGPPDRIESAVSEAEKPRAVGTAPTVRLRWVYKYIDGIGNDVVVEFSGAPRSGEYRVVVDPKTLFRPTA